MSTLKSHHSIIDGALQGPPKSYRLRQATLYNSKLLSVMLRKLAGMKYGPDWIRLAEKYNHYHAHAGRSWGIYGAGTAAYQLYRRIKETN